VPLVCYGQSHFWLFLLCSVHSCNGGEEVIMETKKDLFLLENKIKIIKKNSRQ